MAESIDRPARALPPPPAEFADDAVAWATWLYHAEGRTQHEVAEALGVSRATIANHLAEARRRGLVSVSIAPDLLARVELSRALAARYRLDGALVIPEAGTGEAGLRRRLGLAAAQTLLPRLGPESVLGVARGRTMLAVAEALPERAMPRLRVVQVSGSSLGDAEYSPEFCTALIATRLGARCENLHAPAVLSTAAMRDALVREPGIARQLARLRSCDIVVLGIGELDRATSFASETDFMTPAMVEQYVAAGGVGVVMGRFLDARGQEIGGPLSGRQIGMELADLRATPVRLCVAGGARKQDAIRAALAGGLASHLVTDAATAVALLEAGR